LGSCKGSTGNFVQFPSQRFPSRNTQSSTSFNPKSLASSAGSVTSKPRRVLTPKEIDEKRTNNMCFFCDEKYYPGHKCAGQVYRLDIVEDVGSEEGQEEDLDGSGELLMPTEEQHLIDLQAL